LKPFLFLRKLNKYSLFYNDISHFILTGGVGEVKALLVLRHEATNVLERAVGFSFFQWHTTFKVIV
tara:strand:- start:16 stop:213 length:198 start_codon:yes stop_codon:yes gene_type:complete